MVMHCWKCPLCGRQTEREVQDWCACTKMDRPQQMRRDWQAENANVDKGAFHGGGIRHKLLTDGGNKIDPY